MNSEKDIYSFVDYHVSCNKNNGKDAIEFLGKLYSNIVGLLLKKDLSEVLAISDFGSSIDNVVCNSGIVKFAEDDFCVYNIEPINYAGEKYIGLITIEKNKSI